MSYKNKQKNNEYAKNWKIKNRERHLLQRKNRRNSTVGRFEKYTQNARVRGLSFTIDLKTFESIVKQNCHYCNKEEAKGVDRIDSKLGYFTGNILPCCKTCNIMKMAHSYDEFTEHIKQIYQNLL